MIARGPSPTIVYCHAVAPGERGHYEAEFASVLDAAELRGRRIVRADRLLTDAQGKTFGTWKPNWRAVAKQVGTRLATIVQGHQSGRVLFLSAGRFEWLVCAQMMASLAESEYRPEVVLHCHGLDYVRTGRFSHALPLRLRGYAFYRRVRQLMGRSWEGHFQVLASTKALAGFIRERLQLPSMNGPMTFAYPRSIPAEDAHSAAGRVAFIGQLRDEKGSALIVPTIKCLLRMRPGIEIVVSAPNPTDDIRRTCSEYDQVTLSGWVDDREDYLAQFATCDVFVLPYSPDAYRMRTSGILSEAIAMARAVVTPNNTALAEPVLDGRATGSVFDSWHPEAIAKATVDVLSVFTPSAADRRRQANEWRRHQSVERFVDLVLAEAPSPTQ